MLTGNVRWALAMAQTGHQPTLIGATFPAVSPSGGIMTGNNVTAAPTSDHRAALGDRVSV